ncbi:glycosyltransferase [Belliella aquatica]|uniref:Glycosyl transferase n=1 Tax=Belliella aquatica TaxID=1323734 RepID=A0ABQ1N5R6_9BACT|nr:glycosyltransferase [Belliella aquatica]MCH7407509.1 glycosyltransferase [Belliella aquatica]GGC54182.1 glycosyl transferase [Belliella aquatica]
MLIFYLIIGIVYAFILSILSKSWRGQGENNPIAQSNEQVTLIVPFRNEADKLKKIFESIENLNYDHLEILWVNDHSEDASVVVLNELLNSKNLRFDHHLIQAEGKGKKAAIETAIKHAPSDFVFTTDADCELPPTWIKHKMAHFENLLIQMVAGPVMTKERNTAFQRFQQIEWSSILLVTQYAIAHQNPLMCSGANLAYRKQAFQKVNGYQGNRNVLSGDDEFLMKKISDEFGAEAITYANGKESLVLTNAAKNWDELFSQRIRWASKYKSHNYLHFLSALLPALLQLFWIVSFILPFSYGLEGVVAFLITWSLKMSMEFVSLSKVTKVYLLRLNFLDFCYTSLIHPFYVLRVALGAVFGNYKWKGRS